jgi:hypothetical protein
VIQGAESIGVPLDEHIGVVLRAMQAAAVSLGLAGSASAPAGASTAFDADA